MKDLGPTFDVGASRRRFLKAAMFSVCCMVGIWLLSLAATDPRLAWGARLSAAGAMLILLVWGWVFSMAAWVRWLDWTRGQATMKGSV